MPARTCWTAAPGDDDLYVGSVGEVAGDQVKGGDGTDRLLADFSAKTTAISFVALDSLQIYSVGSFTVTGVERYESWPAATSTTS